MLRELQNKYSDEGQERLGFILASGDVIELTNAHDDPEMGAQFKSSDIYRYLYSDDAADLGVTATWHTHPAESNSLSGEDYPAFKSHPKLSHYIVGNNGVRRYYIEEGTIKYD